MYKQIIAALVVASTAGCTDDVIDESVDPIAEEADEQAAEQGFRPLEAKPECEPLAKAKRLPAGTTNADIVNCLTDESRARFDRAIRKRMPGGIDEYLASEGAKVIRERAQEAAPQEAADPGTAEPAATTLAALANWGFSSAHCGANSCLTRSIPVNGGVTRKIGYRTAVKTPTYLASADPEKRIMDDVHYGTVPDFLQRDLRDESLQSAGCGPVAAVNLFEWWNIPVTFLGRELVSFDERAERLAAQMDTLDGANYTDDENLVETLRAYKPAGLTLLQSPNVEGGPRDSNDDDDQDFNKRQFDRLLNLVGQGYPVVALYSTGEASLHWATILGYHQVNGQTYLRIANGNEKTVDQFRHSWGWGDLTDWNDWWAEIDVTKFQFHAYTRGEANPYLRSAARQNRLGEPGASLPGYGVNGFRYCNRPGDAPPFGTCFFNGTEPAFALARNGNSVTMTAALRAFIIDNPSVRAEYWGLRRGTWVWERIGAPITLDAVKNNASIPFPAGFAPANYMHATFFVHSPDYAKVTWSP